MDNKTDYEKALATAWNVFWNKHFRGKEDTSIKVSEVFDDAFLRGYRSGLEAAKAQTESEPEHIPETEKKIDRSMMAAMAMQALVACDDSQDADIVANNAVFCRCAAFGA